MRNDRQSNGGSTRSYKPSLTERLVNDELNENPKRGLKYDGVARRLLRRYPDGSAFSDAKFSAFIRNEELVEGLSRSEAAERIRSASTHSRMNAGDDHPFTLRSDHNGQWHVRRVQTVLSKAAYLTKVTQAVDQVKREVLYLLQAAQSHWVSEIQQIKTRLGVEAVDEWAEDTSVMINRLSTKLQGVPEFLPTSPGAELDEGDE